MVIIAEDLLREFDNMEVANVETPVGYKMTELGLIPEDWEVKTILTFAPLQRGFDLPSAELKLGTYPVVYSNGIVNHHIVAKIKGPGVVTGRSGTIGKVHFIKTNYWPHNTTLWVTNFNGNHPKYTYYLYQYIGFERFSTGSGVPTLNRNDIHSFKISVPPAKEQEKIAAVLSDLDALITNLNQLIAKKRDIKLGIMQLLLTGKQRLSGFSGEWKSKRIGEVFQFLSTANNPRSDLSKHGEIGYIHYGDIHGSSSPFLDCSKQKIPYINLQKVKALSFLEEGDLVIADASEDYEGIGKSVEILNINNKKIVAGLHTFLLRGNKNIIADGFKGYIQFIPSLRTDIVRLSTGISVYGISKNNLRGIEVKLPPIHEQKAITNAFSDMNTEINVLEQKLDKIRNLKQGMMQKLLTGRIRLV